jgi:hypothetical protein
MSDMAASAPTAAVPFRKVRLSVIFVAKSVVYPRMQRHVQGFMPLPNIRLAEKQPVIIPAREFLQTNCHTGAAPIKPGHEMFPAQPSHDLHA